MHWTSKSVRANLRSAGVFLAACSLGSSLLAQATSAPVSAANPDAETVELDPFTINTSRDLGYAANNSLSATRLAVPIADLPRSINVVTDTLIADTGRLNLGDALRFVSGVSVQQPVFNNNYIIRGLEQQFVFRNFYRYLGNTWNVNVDRVEVIKGPSAVLYGVSDPGGQINYLTKRPEFRSEVQLSVTAGSDGLQRGILDYQDTALNERLGIRLIAAAQNQDSPIPNVFDDKRLVAGSMLAKLSARDTLFAEFEWSGGEYQIPYTAFTSLPVYRDATGSATLLATANGLANAPLTNELGQNVARTFWTPVFSNSRFGYEKFENPTTVYSLEYKRRLTDTWFLTASLSRTDQNRLWFGTDAGAYVPLENPNVSSASATGSRPGDYRQRAFREDNSILSTNATLLLTGDVEVLGIKNKPLVGFVYYGDAYRYLRYNSHVAAPDRPINSYVTRVEYDFTDPRFVDQRYVFDNRQLGDTYFRGYYATNTTYLLDDRLILLYGARRDEIKNRFRFLGGNGTQTATEFNPASVFDGGYLSNAKTSIQGGALYKATSGLSLFVNYSESLRDQLGSFRSPDSPTTVGAQSPTEGKGYDVGIKSALLENRLTGTLSYFELKRDNVVRTLNLDELPAALRDPSTGQLLPQFSNLSFQQYFNDVESKGVELDMAATPIDNWSIVATFAYIDATQKAAVRDLTKRAPANNNAGELVFRRYRLPSTPRTQGSFFTRYTFAGGPLNALFVGGGAIYVGDRDRVSSGGAIFDLNTYWTFDFLAGYDFKVRGQRIRSQLNIRNLTDEREFETERTYTAPRTIELTLSTRF